MYFFVATAIRRGYLFNILGERRHLDGLGASKMLAFPSVLR
jgi:hypothetical protein